MTEPLPSDPGESEASTPPGGAGLVPDASGTAPPTETGFWRRHGHALPLGIALLMACILSFSPLLIGYVTEEHGQGADFAVTWSELNDEQHTALRAIGFTDAFGLNGTGPGWDLADAEVDDLDRLWLAGSSTSGLDVGGMRFAPLGDDDVVVLLLDANGTWVTALLGGGPGHDVATDLAVDADEGVVVIGLYRGDVDFGRVNLTQQSTYSTDRFAIKVDPAGEWSWGLSIGQKDFEDGALAFCNT